VLLRFSLGTADAATSIKLHEASAAERRKVGGRRWRGGSKAAEGLALVRAWAAARTQAHQQKMQTLLTSVLCRRVGDKQPKRSALDSLVFNGNMSLGHNGMAEGWKAFGEGYSWYVRYAVSSTHPERPLSYDWRTLLRRPTGGRDASKSDPRRTTPCESGDTAPYTGLPYG
jgi:hypothetical protein